MKKKIAVVGGGFYGCYFANKIKKLKKNYEIHIFEKNSELLSEAGLNNQYRLHRGFHYPRSKDTIIQTNLGASKFIREFKKFLYFPDKNYYVIHKKSKVSIKEYNQIFTKFKIPFKQVQKDKLNILKNKKQFEGVINTREGVILLDKLVPYLKKITKKNCKIFLNTQVNFINSNKNTLKTNLNKKFVGYDYIFNCSFTDLNLGLKNKFKVKYEIACMLRFKKIIKESMGITIVDGPFISMYPCNKNEVSLSSVTYTPYKKFKNLNKMRNFKLGINDYKKIKRNILNHTKKYLKLKKLGKIRFIISPKVKIINDRNDIRTSQFKINKKVISILCGKLDAVPIIWKKIEEKLFI